MITLRQATDLAEVEAILCDEELFSRIAEDGTTGEDLKMSISDDHHYMLIDLDGSSIGVWCVYPANSTTLNIHCNILSPYRSESREAWRLISNWFVSESPNQYQKINAEIPVIYPEVYHYTKNCGFLDEGVNRLSIKKDGVIIDQWKLGLTREEAAGNVIR